MFESEPSAGDLIGDFARDEHRGDDRLRTEKLLVESMSSPSSEMTDADWSEVRALARKADSAGSKRRSR